MLPLDKAIAELTPIALEELERLDDQYYRHLLVLRDPFLWYERLISLVGSRAQVAITKSVLV